MIKLVQIQTTSKCNGYCSFCPYESSWMIDNKGYMSDELYTKILNDTNKYDNEFSGKFCPYLMNEPTLDPKLIDRIEEAYSILHNPLIEVSTNASALTHSKIDKLKKILIGKRFKLVISLHGINEKSHNKLMKTDWDTSLDNAIYAMKELDCPIALQSMSSSIDGSIRILLPRKIRRFWNEIISDNYIGNNVFFSTFQFHNRAGGLKSMWTYNFVERESLKGFDCSRFHNSLHVLWNGEVVSCCMDYNHEEIIGDLTKETVSEVMNGKLRRNFIDKGTGKIESSNNFICKRCTSPGG